MRTTWRRQHPAEIRPRFAVIGRLSRSSVLLVLLAVFQYIGAGLHPTEAQTVRAVLFFSPTCQHCHEVITQYLPGLFDSYGGAPRASVDPAVSDEERALYLFHNGQLEILLVDASKSNGTELYLASNLNQAIAPERAGVPRLVIGDVVLVGSIEIPERTGDLVRRGLEQGGLAWPLVDGLQEAIASIPGAVTAAVATESDSAAEAVETPEDRAATPAPAPAAVADSVAPKQSEARPTTAVDTSESIEISDPAPAAVPDTPSAFETIQTRRPTMVENFQLDLVGNSFSVVVLLLMIASFVAVWLKLQALPSDWGVGFGIPTLALIGAAVASYLTYIEATGAVAVCGPVGDCNTVNQSEWARLFGVLPIGALGLLGYTAIVLAWAASKYASERMSAWARLSLLVMTAGGTLFSIYLTFLEPFVIGATCAWCLTSSVLITALLWLSGGSGRDAYTRIRRART